MSRMGPLLSIPTSISLVGNSGGDLESFGGFMQLCLLSQYWVKDLTEPNCSALPGSGSRGSPSFANDSESGTESEAKVNVRLLVTLEVAHASVHSLG